jgi:AcrR family transcriptional regulator
MTRLVEADLVRAGRRIAERVGARAMTMRMLAAELGVSTMAAYRHVVSKTELLVLMADDILSCVVIPSPEAGEWDEKLVILESRFPACRIFGIYSPPAERLRRRYDSRPRWPTF